MPRTSWMGEYITFSFLSHTATMAHGHEEIHLLLCPLLMTHYCS